MSEPRVLWAWLTTNTFYQLVSDEYAGRFDGEYLITKDLVLGATTAAQSYVDLGAFVVGPLTLRCEFSSSALRNTFQSTIGTTGTLSNSLGISYTALLVKATRIENGGLYIVDAMWEQR